MADVEVSLSHESYCIHIGPRAINGLGDWIGKQRFTRRALLITDGNVGGIYGDTVLEFLRGAGYQAEAAFIEPGEDSKSINTAMCLYTKAITLGLDRKSPIIALGGGVVGDLAGYVAATYLRGVPFIQIPTTLLSQVDSSVGGKVAINHDLGKNLIGAFYQPRIVLIDTDMLQTLPDREVRAGMAEIIKYGVIADKDLFAYLSAYHTDILSRDPKSLIEIIQRSCHLKADIVGKDEREAGVRIILNFGHTIAHAIEGNAGFCGFNHGEAVAVGMYGAMLISCYMGLCSHEAVAAVKELLVRYGLPVKVSSCSSEDLMTYVNRDKKVISGKLNWVLAREIGDVTVNDAVPEDIVMRVLAELT